MAETSIEWADYTVNLWKGCTKCAPGCVNCYAEAMARRLGEQSWGKSAPRIWCKHATDTLRRLNRSAARRGVVEKVFVNSNSDLFEDHDGPVVDHKGDPVHRINGELAAVPGLFIGKSLATIADLRVEGFRVIDECRNLIFILLTKRPENILRMWFPRLQGLPPLGAVSPGKTLTCHRPNVWLLTSVSDQETLERNADYLERCRALTPVLGLSCEPLLGPLNFAFINYRMFDWIIAGGESGPGARPMHPDWARSLRDQCAAAGVPFHFKQWGEWKPISEMTEAESDALYRSNRTAKPHESQEELDDVWGKTCRVETQGIQYDGAFGWKGGDPFHIPYQTFRVGKKAAGRLLDGVTHDAAPNPQA